VSELSSSYGGFCVSDFTSMDKYEVLHELWVALGKPEKYSDFQDWDVKPLVEDAVAAIKLGAQRNFLKDLLASEWERKNDE
jgi:hypothetical protein